MTRHKLIYITALLLPIVFLGIQATHLVWNRIHAPAYTVLVTGFDPRDLVYGEYLQFRLNWTDPRSQKPSDTRDLPDTARMYLPEGNAYDLQSMLQDGKNTFTANIQLNGRKASIRELFIDGRPWKDGLAAWRMQDRKPSL